MHRITKAVEGCQKSKCHQSWPSISNSQVNMNIYQQTNKDIN